MWRYYERLLSKWTMCKRALIPRCSGNDRQQWVSFFPLPQKIDWERGQYHLRLPQMSFKLRLVAIYRITGNFGGGFNLAIWRLKSQPPNKKIANKFTSAHAQYASGVYPHFSRTMALFTDFSRVKNGLLSLHYL